MNHKILWEVQVLDICPIIQVTEVRDVVSHWEDFAAMARVDDGLNKVICEEIMKDVEE